jgi:hypothetical protein
MMFLTLSNGQQIVATPDQLLLRSDRTLTPSHQLRVGDLLLGGGRQSITLLKIVSGIYHGEVCEIATSADSPMDGHLIEANGVIAADYDLQVERQEA